MPKRSSFRNRFSFYLLAIGSACGLGNLWRFPYIVGENGGGAFLLLYVFLALTVGMTLLIAELMLGHFTGVSVLAASRKVSIQSKKPIAAFGWLSVIISAVTLAYYSVICGWVLHYLTQFIMSLFQSDSSAYLSHMSVTMLQQNGWLQFMLASVHLLISVVIIVKGLGDGVERWITSLLPVFGLLVVVLLIGSLSLDSTPDVLRFLFYPDFSKLNWNSLGHAVGHVFFTLSLGFGTMVTFGSYFRKDEEHLPTLGLRVTLIDTLISIVAVLLIFPIAFSTTKQPLTDPSLLFEVLPRFLSTYKGGVIFGLTFFLCLWLAALNASLGLLETITANLVEKRPHLKRSVAASISGLAILFVTVFPAFSGSLFKSFKLRGHGLIEIFDSFLINGLLPIAGLGMVIIVTLGLTENDRKELFLHEKSITSQTMYPHWRSALKWVVPAVIVLGLLLQVLGLFFA
ncbi:MAG: sodium-dependent transporter [Bdellovibrionaceae bacterium]|nr:sodium-dependent transporter [Bdellovibrio sp.]